MADVVGGYMGLKGKKITLGLTITKVVGRRFASRSVKERYRVGNDFDNVKKDFKKKHNIEKGGLNQEELAKDGSKFVSHAAKLFMYEVIIHKSELENIQDMEKIITAIEILMNKYKQKKEIKILKKFGEEILKAIIKDEEETGVELKKLFGLERESRGKESMAFNLKSLKQGFLMTMIKRFQERKEFSHIARDYDRIRNNTEALEGMYKQIEEDLKKGKDVKSIERKINHNIDVVIGEVKDEIVNARRLVFNNWLNFQMVIGVLTGEAVLDKELMDAHEIPINMGKIDKARVGKILEQANADLQNEQKMLNSIYREEKETEKGAREMLSKAA